MNKKHVFWVFLGIISTFICFYWYSSNQNKIENLTASDIDNELKQANETIAASEITKYFPDDISILFSKYYEAYGASEFNYEKGITISRVRTNHFEVVSSRTGFYYSVGVKENEGAIFCQITKNFLPNYYLKEIVDKLIHEQGFTLKESDTKYGVDFLIKDFSKYYVVIAITPNSNQSDPVSLTITSKSK